MDTCFTSSKRDLPLASFFTVKQAVSLTLLCSSSLVGLTESQGERKMFQFEAAQISSQFATDEEMAFFFEDGDLQSILVNDGKSYGLDEDFLAWDAFI